jgi:hypothetical protein
MCSDCSYETLEIATFQKASPKVNKCVIIITSDLRQTLNWTRHYCCCIVGLVVSIILTTNVIEIDPDGDRLDTRACRCDVITRTNTNKMCRAPSRSGYMQLQCHFLEAGRPDTQGIECPAAS